MFCADRAGSVCRALLAPACPPPPQTAAHTLTLKKMMKKWKKKNEQTETVMTVFVCAVL